MLTKLEVYAPHTTTTLEIPIASDAYEPYQIRNINGLEPVRAAVNTTPYGSMDGEGYSGSTVGKRNIVITLGMHPDWQYTTMSSLRKFLYRYFMPKDRVRLRFFSDDLVTCEIAGYVESMEPNIFSKDPEILISVICPLPDFVAITATVVDGVVGPDVEDIFYAGSVSTGFTLKVESSVANPSYTGIITVENGTIVDGSGADESLQVSTTVDATHRAEFGTERGNKYARSVTVPGGVPTSILNTLMDGSIWPRLYPGHNNFRVSAGEIDQMWQLSYLIRYGGL